MRVGFVNLFSKNPERLRKFYRETVGIRPIPKQNKNSSWYGFLTKGATFAIEPIGNRKAFKGRNKSNALIQFKISSKRELNSLNKTLEKRGVRLIYVSRKSSYGYLTNFLDPDGNLIELLAPIKN